MISAARVLLRKHSVDNTTELEQQSKPNKCLLYLQLQFPNIYCYLFLHDSFHYLLRRQTTMSRLSFHSRVQYPASFVSQLRSKISKLGQWQVVRGNLVRHKTHQSLTVRSFEIFLDAAPSQTVSCLQHCLTSGNFLQPLYIVKVAGPTIHKIQNLYTKTQFMPITNHEFRLIQSDAKNGIQSGLYSQYDVFTVLKSMSPRH